MKVYVLIEQCFENYNESYVTVLGVFKTKEQSEKEKEKIIKDNIENFDFVIDNESANRIFNCFQENWNNYIEYQIIGKEVF